LSSGTCGKKKRRRKRWINERACQPSWREDRIPLTLKKGIFQFSMIEFLPRIFVRVPIYQHITCELHCFTTTQEPLPHPGYEKSCYKWRRWVFAHPGEFISGCKIWKVYFSVPLMIMVIMTKYYYSDSCYGVSTGSASNRKLSMRIKITLTFMIVMILICNYDCGAW